MRTLLALLLILIALPIQADRRGILLSKKEAAAGGGGGGFTGSNPANLAHWLKADDLSLNDGDPVDTWTAATGNSATGSGGQRPTFQTAEYGALPTVRFDGTDDTMSISISADASQTIFIVAKRTASDSKTLASFGGELTAQIYNDASGPFTFYEPVQAASAGSAQAIGVVVMKFDSTSSASIRMQSGAWATFNPNDTYASQTTLQIVGQGGSTFMDADVCEVLIYSSALSDSDCNLVGNYLERWGLTWTDL